MKTQTLYIQVEVPADLVLEIYDEESLQRVIAAELELDEIDQVEISGAGL